VAATAAVTVTTAAGNIRGRVEVGTSGEQVQSWSWYEAVLSIRRARDKRWPLPAARCRPAPPLPFSPLIPGRDLAPGAKGSTVFTC